MVRFGAGGGIKKLSELIIDTDKDWLHNKILNAYFEITDEPHRDYLFDYITQKHYEISDHVYVSNDPEKKTDSHGYVKLKEFTLPDDFPTNTTLRIYFELRTSNDRFVAYGRIYKNETPVGTVRTTDHEFYTSFTEDINGWNPGDKVQLYARTETTIGNADACVRNFRILGSPLNVKLGRDTIPELYINGQKYDIQATIV